MFLSFPDCGTNDVALCLSILLDGSTIPHLQHAVQAGLRAVALNAGFPCPALICRSDTELWEFTALYSLLNHEFEIVELEFFTFTCKIIYIQGLFYFLSFIFFFECVKMSALQNFSFNLVSYFV